MIPINPSANRDRGLRTVEGAVGHLFEMSRHSADRDREQNEREPDVIEHDYSLAARGAFV